MADAKQCDGCKKFYNPRNDTHRPSMYGSYIQGMKFFGDHGVISVYDLCEECTDKLVKFMNNEEDNDA